MENKPSVGTITRTAVLILTMVNMLLEATGRSVLPFSDEDVSSFVSTIAFVVSSVVAWWKNNSFTAPAIEADKLMHKLKRDARK